MEQTPEEQRRAAFEAAKIASRFSLPAGTSGCAAGCAWVLLAVSVGGVAFLLPLILAEGAGVGPPGFLFFLAASAAGAPAAVFWLWRQERRRRTAQPQRRAQLFTTDLLTVSFVMAAFLLLVERFAPNDFARYGIAGGGALLFAMLLALLRASRCGYLSGTPRAAYALGLAASLLGAGGAGLLVFFLLLGIGIGQLGDVLNWLTLQGLNVLRAGVGGVVALVLGQALLYWAQRKKAE